MFEVRDATTADPIALAPGEGERIWFTNCEFTFKATASSTGGELLVLEALLPAGFGPPLHVHHNEHEAFYVLEGRLEIVCGSSRFDASTGAFAFLPSGIAHTFRVIDPARVLSIAVPGGLEGFFREVGRPALHAGLPPAGPIDIEALERAATRHGNEFVGPPLSSS